MLNAVILLTLEFNLPNGFVLRGRLNGATLFVYRISCFGFKNIKKAEMRV
jgi:hypothetical protein